MADLLTSMSNVGLPTADDSAQRIPYYGWDTITWGKKSSNEDFAILKESYLFRDDKKDPQLISTAFPLTEGRVIRLEAMRAVHNLNFEDPDQLQIFEQLSRIVFQIEDVDYSALPLHEILPYERVLANAKRVAVAVDTATSITTTTTEQYQILHKGGAFKKLLKPVEIPHKGKIIIKFAPGGSDLKTANVTNYGTKFGQGIVNSADDAVFFVRIEWVGQLVRRIQQG